MYRGYSVVAIKIRFFTIKKQLNIASILTIISVMIRNHVKEGGDWWGRP